MSYVARKFEMSCIRTENDYARFERNHRGGFERQARAWEVMADPDAVKTHTQCAERPSVKYTIWMDPIHNCVAAVVDGHV